MKQNKNFLILFIVAASLIACNSNNNASGNDADTATASTDGTMVDTATGTAGALSDADRDFMLEAAKGGLMEVEAGKIAQEKATVQRIKDFGAMMVRDHSQANQELKSLASAKNVMLPDTLDADMKEHMESMRKMSGKQFDKHYVDMMKDDHKDDISKFENASNNATDPDVKAFASKTLPILRMHRDSVDAMSEGMK